MTLQTRIYTADDLERLPDDGWRYELVQGELRKMAPAGHDHGRIVGTFSIELGRYIRDHKLGAVYGAETGFVLTHNPDTVRAPDMAFVAQERVNTPTSKEGYWPGAPDLAVEVISPGDSYAEVEENVADWLNAGTRMVMVINPRTRWVTVYRTGNSAQVYKEDDMLDAGDVVPGWTIPVREIFE
jgi:Uma2 family endonuclease